MFNNNFEIDQTSLNNVILFGKFLGMVEAFGYKTKNELPEDQRQMVQNVLDAMTQDFIEMIGELFFQIEFERMLETVLGEETLDDDILKNFWKKLI